MKDTDFINFFNSITDSNVKSERYSNEDELDELYKEYNDFVEELKKDGYKVLRNSKGKHKVTKCT